VNCADTLNRACCFARWVAATTLIGALLPAAPAQADPPRIAVLAPFGTSSPQAALREGFRELGYIEGENLIIDWRVSSRTLQEFRLQAAELLALRPDIIVAFSTPATRAALDATTSIPVVFYVGDPIGSGVAASLAKPEGNATGVSSLSTELTAKRLDLLHQLLPKARRVAYLIYPTNPLTPLQLQQAQSSSRVLGLQLRPLEVRSVSDLDTALSDITPGNTDAVLVTDAFFRAERTKIANATRAARVPLMFGWKGDPRDGVLISYGPSFRDGARRVAGYVDKVLKGTKPSQLPIEQNATYELIINLRVARDLGIEVPQEILLRANEVVR